MFWTFCLCASVRAKREATLGGHALVVRLQRVGRGWVDHLHGRGARMARVTASGYPAGIPREFIDAFEEVAQALG